MSDKMYHSHKTVSTWVSDTFGEHIPEAAESCGWGQTVEIVGAPMSDGCQMYIRWGVRWVHQHVAGVQTQARIRLC